MRFRFIDAERAGLAMPIFRLCRLLQVSVSGFYAWRNRGPSQRQLDDMVLLAHVRAAFRRSRESYGAERVHHELAENGIEVGRHRVARLMRGNGLSPKRKQKFKKTTDSQHNKAVVSNLLDQNFSAEAPNEKWAADISYIWTAQGWLYLAVMLDLYSRRVIGWAVGARMTSDLPLRALNRAIGLRQPGAGVIHHSDRGSHVVLLLNGGRPFPHWPSGAALTESPHRAAKIAPRRRQFPGHHPQASDQHLSAFSIRGAASVGAPDWNKDEFTTSATPSRPVPSRSARPFR